MSSTAPPSPRRHRLTVEEYNRMGEAGILRPDERVELIEGEILDMAPPGSRHAGTVNQLLGLLQRAVGDRAILLVQNPISLGSHSEPQPDFALARPREDYYKSAHPRATEVLLVIEISDASLRFERDVKVSLYARHGIPEVWLIDLRGKRLTRYRNPTEGAYARVDEPDVGAPLEVGAVADVRVDLGPLFAD